MITAPFEEAALPHDHYDFVAAATSFHWIQPLVGLTKIASVLKPGWTLVLNTQQVGSLYATFSHISRFPEEQRATIQHQLMEVADKYFYGRVERNMVSPVI